MTLNYLNFFDKNRDEFNKILNVFHRFPPKIYQNKLTSRLVWINILFMIFKGWLQNRFQIKLQN